MIHGALGLLVDHLAFFHSIPATLLRRRGRDLVGLFHPYTNDDGGGERDLWCSVRAVQEENPDLDCAVFTGDDASPQSLAARALDRFGVKLLRLPQVEMNDSRFSLHHLHGWNSHYWPTHSSAMSEL